MDSRADILRKFNIWKSNPNYQRFGQWYLNNLEPHVSDSIIYNCENSRKALNMILNDPRFCSEFYPTTP